MGGLQLLETILNTASCLAAGTAAYYWFRTSRVKFPPKVTVGYGGVGGSIQEISNSMIEQSRYNAYGAASAMIAAILQGFGMLI